MRRRSNELSFFATCAAISLFAGCGAAEEPAPVVDFPAEPYAILASHEGKLTIEVRTGPAQPPLRGRSDVQLIVRDAQGAFVDGLSLEATPWMPAMGHGSSVEPIPVEHGEGRYSLRNVSLYMAGRWEVRTSFSGVVTDSATPVFDVP
jgi:hypothetical protein